MSFTAASVHKNLPGLRESLFIHSYCLWNSFNISTIKIVKCRFMLVHQTTPQQLYYYVKAQRLESAQKNVNKLIRWPLLQTNNSIIFNIQVPAHVLYLGIGTFPLKSKKILFPFQSKILYFCKIRFRQIIFGIREQTKQKLLMCTLK